MNEPAEREEIKRYVEKAFLAKIMQNNERRGERYHELYESLGARGYSRVSSACILGELEIEETCVAELLHQKAELYIDVYQRKGLRIGPEVLGDISFSQVELTTARKVTLMGQAQMTALRTNQPSTANCYAHFGKKASLAIKEIEAEIDL